MAQIKNDLKPAELAALVRKNMEESAPTVDLSTLVNMDQIEDTIVEMLRETHFLVVSAPSTDTKH